MRRYRTYDDPRWHSGGDYPVGLPKENAATHIGIFLAWAIAAGLASRMHTDRRSPLVRRLQARTITPGQYFLKRCYCKLRPEDFNDRGNRFVRAKYDDYLADIESFFDDHESLYHVPDTWANFDLYKEELDDMLATWEAKAERTGPGL
jgi:hypothetical protein